MSCWVVPSVAAEVWGTTIDHVLSGIRDGSIPTRSEKGFTFVDVAPDSELAPTIRRRKEERPPTFVSLTQEETTALLAPLATLDGYIELPESRDEDEALDHLLADIATAETDSEIESDEDGESASISVENWREARTRVARRRVAPMRLDLN